MVAISLFACPGYSLALGLGQATKSSRGGRTRRVYNHYPSWLVLWNMFYDIPIILGIFHHPKWRTQSIIFQRARAQPQPPGWIWRVHGSQVQWPNTTKTYGHDKPWLENMMMNKCLFQAPFLIGPSSSTIPSTTQKIELKVLENTRC